MDFTKSIAFIGGGNMAEALAGGITRSGILPPGSIVLSHYRAQRREYLRETLGFKVTPDNAEAVKTCGTIFLSLKPKVIPEVLEEISGVFQQGQLVISIAAGITLSFLESRLPGIPVIRSMPNTPALIGSGATVIVPGTFVRPEMIEWAVELFKCTGACQVLSEDLMDAVTGLSGSGPAYIFRMAEALTEAGISLGIPGEKASALVKQTILGAARMMMETEDAPARLREKVASPGGTTEAALKSLEEDGFEEIVKKAVTTAAGRSRELGKN